MNTKNIAIAVLVTVTVITLIYATNLKSENDTLKKSPLPDDKKLPEEKKAEPKKETKTIPINERKPLLIIIKANKDMAVRTAPIGQNNDGEQVKAGEIIGLVPVKKWNQYYEPMGEFTPVEILFTKKWKDKDLTDTTEVEISKDDIEHTIKQLPVRYINKGDLSLTKAGLYFKTPAK